MVENLTDKEKDVILREIFLDQAAELRVFKADMLVDSGKAKTFREACEMIKAEEVLKEKEKVFVDSYNSLSEQEKWLMETFKLNRDE